MEFGWSDDEQRFRKELRTFISENLPANWSSISRDGPGSDAQAGFSREFCAKLAERNWLTPHWPKSYGGEEASLWVQAIAGEELWAAGEPRGPQYMNVNWIGPTIMRFGSEEQKRDHLPRIGRGEVLWCQGFSEPNAGSDLASLTTRAERRGDVYVVNGQKVWTSYCKNAQFCFLLARTSLESRHRGLSVLLMPMNLPGVEVREIDTVLGDRYFHELFLNDVAVSAGCRLGAENDGWKVAMAALQYERAGLPRYARAARLLDRLAADTGASGALKDPAVAERFGQARALCEAARLLYYRVIDQRVRDATPSAEANLARVALTMADQAASQLALEIEGLEALVYGSRGDMEFRAAMPAGVATGTTEINLNLVAERWLGLPRER